MSNKLVKRSEGYENVKKKLIEKVNKEGGINLNGKLILEYIGEDDAKKCSEEEYFKILEELSNEGYCLYKIEKVAQGKSSKGMMLCKEDVTLAFLKPEEENGEDTEESNS